MRAWFAVLICVLVAAIAGVFIWRGWPRPAPAEGGEGVVRAASLDVLLKELAQRVAQQSGEAKDFRVLVTVYQEPIGALMEPGRSIADDDVSCRPKTEPEKRDAPNLFPVIETNRAVAGDFGLQAPLAQLGEAHASTRDADTVALRIDEPGRRALTGAVLRSVLNDPACRQAIGGRTMWLVRGYISGRREVILSSDRSVDLKGGAKLASFDIAPAGRDKLSVKDDQDRMFLQIVSEVQAPPAPAAAAGSSEVRLAAPMRPVVAPGGRIYIQQDVADDSNPAGTVLAALKGYNVVPKVEKIPSAKMPRAPQVRYFNEGDKSKAEEVAAALKSARLQAEVVRIALPAPVGQLEVWLPRVGGRTDSVLAATLKVNGAAHLAAAAAVANGARKTTLAAPQR